MRFRNGKTFVCDKSERAISCKFFFHDLHITILCSGLKQKTICLKDGKACHKNCSNKIIFTLVIKCLSPFSFVRRPLVSQCYTAVFSVSSLLSRATVKKDHKSTGEMNLAVNREKN